MSGVSDRELPPPPDPRELLRAAGLAPKKSWGQNFLLDQTVLSDIAAAALGDDDLPVVELGAGLGALTHHLALARRPMVAVERDRDLVPVLTDSFSWAPWLRIVAADAASLDYRALAADFGAGSGGAAERGLVVCGNLPYQLSSRILVSLTDEPVVTRAVVLVQREVAERLAAEPGGRDFGLLSVLVQRRFSVELRRDVPPGAFLPPPKITSTVVRLDARSGPWASDPHLIAAARAAFSQRRKTLRNSLRGSLRIEGERLVALDGALVAAGVEPTARAETLGLDDFLRLGQALAAAGLLAGAAEVSAPNSDP